MSMALIYEVLETIRADISTEHTLVKMNLTTNTNSCIISMDSLHISDNFEHVLHSLPYVSFAFPQVNPDNSAFSIICVNQSSFPLAQNTISKFYMMAKLKNINDNITIENFK